MRERGNLDQRRGRSLLAEELLAQRREIDAMLHVCHVGRDLDDARHRPALGFDERFDRFVGVTCLSLEVAATGYAAVRGVGDLSRQEQYRLGLADSVALTVGGRVVAMTSLL